MFPEGFNPDEWEECTPDHPDWPGMVFDAGLGYDPDEWEECPEVEHFLVFSWFTRLLLSSGAIAFAAFFFWLIDNHKNTGKEKSEDGESAAESLIGKAASAAASAAANLVSQAVSHGTELTKRNVPSSTAEPYEPLEEVREGVKERVQVVKKAVEGAMPGGKPGDRLSEQPPPVPQHRQKSREEEAALSAWDAERARMEGESLKKLGERIVGGEDDMSYTESGLIDQLAPADKISMRTSDSREDAVDNAPFGERGASDRLDAQMRQISHGLERKLMNEIDQLAGAAQHLHQPVTRPNRDSDLTDYDLSDINGDREMFAVGEPRPADRDFMTGRVGQTPRESGDSDGFVKIEEKKSLSPEEAALMQELVQEYDMVTTPTPARAADTRPAPPQKHTQGLPAVDPFGRPIDRQEEADQFGRPIEQAIQREMHHQQQQATPTHAPPTQGEGVAAGFDAFGRPVQQQQQATQQAQSVDQFGLPIDPALRHQQQKQQTQHPLVDPFGRPIDVQQAIQLNKESPQPVDQFGRPVAQPTQVDQFGRPLLVEQHRPPLQKQDTLGSPVVGRPQQILVQQQSVTSQHTHIAPQATASSTIQAAGFSPVREVSEGAKNAQGDARAMAEADMLVQDSIEYASHNKQQPSGGFVMEEEMLSSHKHPTATSRIVKTDDVFDRVEAHDDHMDDMTYAPDIQSVEIPPDQMSETSGDLQEYFDRVAAEGHVNPSHLNPLEAAIRKAESAVRDAQAPQIHSATNNRRAPSSPSLHSHTSATSGLSSDGYPRLRKQSSLLSVMGVTSLQEMLLEITSLEDLTDAMRRAGVEATNIIYGIDYTASNKYQGEESFGGRSLHTIHPNINNPYQQVISILGRTITPFATTGRIPVFGFGDAKTSDWSVFPLKQGADCTSLEEVIKVYNEVTPTVDLSGPTNFAPLIYQAMEICQKTQQYHILVIIADGQVTNEKATRRAIVQACQHPLSIIVVGVGDGPWDMMKVFDVSLPKRSWDNFHFVEFHQVMKAASSASEGDVKMAVQALFEIPDQYRKIQELGLIRPH